MRSIASIASCRGLQGTDVPVPRMLHLCEDEAVLGTMFFLMEFVDGTIFWDPALPELSNAQRAKVYDEENRALAALHSVDPAKVGLADFGKAGSYFARQRDRWTKQYRASETERVEDMETLIAWLEKNEPPDDGRASLVHGDYRIDNMIFAQDASSTWTRSARCATGGRSTVTGGPTRTTTSSLAEHGQSGGEGAWTSAWCCRPPRPARA